MRNFLLAFIIINTYIGIWAVLSIIMVKVLNRVNDGNPVDVYSVFCCMFFWPIVTIPWGAWLIVKKVTENDKKKNSRQLTNQAMCLVAFGINPISIRTMDDADYERWRKEICDSLYECYDNRTIIRYDKCFLASIGILPPAILRTQTG